jgi:ankyrin repeat protein
VAGIEGNKDLAEMLLAHGAIVNARDKFDLTPLHWATLRNNKDIAKLLLDHGADVNAKDNTDGDTPLILAAASGDKEIVELLLAHGADVNISDNKGTPLAWAIHTRHNDVADLLRRHGGHE